MIKEKKIVCVMVAMFCFFTMLMTGCELGREVIGASISDITAGGSKNMTVKIAYLQDSRLKDKSTDILFKSNTEKITFVLQPELGEKIILTIDEKDIWKSLTTLILESKGGKDVEIFEEYKDITNKTYIFTSETEFMLDIKVVAGDPTSNATGTGQILSNKQDISYKFTLKVEAKDFA